MFKKILLQIICWLIIFFILAFLIPLPVSRVSTLSYQLIDLKFPKNFYFGASTAAHQIEGNTTNNWTEWEKQNADRLAAEAPSKLSSSPNWEQIKSQATDPNNYISGAGDDGYDKYPEDIQIMKSLGLGAYRFSVEWSRIEPEDGKFDETQLKHYHDEVLALKAAGIEPFVTLWHRTEPLWVSQQGDWENPKTADDFGKYVDFVSKGFGSDVTYYMTFNEPELHIVSGYIQGTLPPQIKSLSRGQTALKNMEAAHNQAFDILHKNNSTVMVGSTLAAQIGEGNPNTLINLLLANALTANANWSFFDATKDKRDFLGIQYYGPTEFNLKFKFWGVSMETSSNPSATEKSDVGTEIYPYDLYEILKQTYARYHKPIFITENGIANADDSLRAKYISDHLYFVKKAIDDGIDIRGYFYWSLLDNFEWASGFWPKFGLVKVDRQHNFTRSLQPSSQIYKQIIEEQK